MECNQKQLAKILGLTDRHVRRLKQEFGLFEKTEGKRTYTLEKCVPEYIEFKTDNSGRKTAINKEKEQAEHEEIKKEISKLKLRKLRGELHEAADVEEFLTEMLISFKNRLISIPQKIAPIIIGENDANSVQNILEAEIFEALQELSEYDPEKIDSDAVNIEIYEDEEDEEEDE